MRLRTDLSDRVRMLLALGLLALVASPVLRRAVDDSYPLSTYPMFARVIEHPWLTLAEGIDDAGQVRRLPPEIVASDEPMQAMRTLRLTAAQGRKALRQLCGWMAERVTRSEQFNAVRRVRIVHARFDPLGYFDGKAAPEQTQTLTSCRVERGR